MAINTWLPGLPVDSVTSFCKGAFNVNVDSVNRGLNQPVHYS